MLLKVGTQVSNALKITLTKFHQHMSCASQVFKGWHDDNEQTNNGLLHDQCYVIVLDVNWTSRTKRILIMFEIDIFTAVARSLLAEITLAYLNSNLLTFPLFFPLFFITFYLIFDFFVLDDQFTSRTIT